MLEKLSGVEALGLIILIVKVDRIVEKENYSLEIFPCPFDLLYFMLNLDTGVWNIGFYFKKKDVGAQQYACFIGEYYVATGSVYPCLSM